MSGQEVSTKVAFDVSLNPYSNGICSMSMRGVQGGAVMRVLILILMEYAL